MTTIDPAVSRTHLENLPQADPLTLGHFRHFVNLARQAPGDWAHMGNFEGTQEGDDALRYQLAQMAYGTALFQHRYTPAYPGLCKDTFERLIEKMMRHEVWAYWELTSRGGNVMDPDLTELGEGWVDPVIRKNVMYSGHLLLMVALHGRLYGDGRYDVPGSLTFKFRPPFRGLGPEDFPYDHGRLEDAIHAEFERNAFIGCECEPNGIFVYCNQFPLLAFWARDQVENTGRAQPAMRGFADAWSRRSDLFKVRDAPKLPMFYMVRQQEVAGAGELKDGALSTIAAAPFMHAWQKEYVEWIYPMARDSVAVRYPDGTIGVSYEELAKAKRAHERDPKAQRFDPMRLGDHAIGKLALCASELGDQECLAGVLAHADAMLEPRWENGGLFYPRLDDLDSGRYVSCVSGNALLANSRINAHDGIWSLFNEPGPREGPTVADLDPDRVTVNRAIWEPSTSSLVVGTGAGLSPSDAQAVTFDRLDPSRSWRVWLDGHFIGVVDPQHRSVMNTAARFDYDPAGQHLRCVMDGRLPHDLILEGA